MSTRPGVLSVMAIRPVVSLAVAVNANGYFVQPDELAVTVVLA